MKAMLAELVELGYPKDTIYLVVMDAMMRLAYEQMGEEGAQGVLAQLRGETSR